MNKTSISEWLTGKKIPDPKSIDILADVLGLDVDTVLTLAGHRPESSPIEEDSPAGRIIAKVKRVRWNGEREDAVMNALDTYLKYDRRATENEIKLP